MKTSKMLCLLLTVCCLTPAAGCSGRKANNSSNSPSAWNDQVESISFAREDVAKMVTFLEYTQDGVSNAEILGWDTNDPATWETVTWTSKNEGHLFSVSFHLGVYDYPRLAGTLDLSNCTSLHFLWCINNQLTALDVTGCKKLEALWCWDNNMPSDASIKGLDKSITKEFTSDWSR